MRGCTSRLEAIAVHIASPASASADVRVSTDPLTAADLPSLIKTTDAVFRRVAPKSMQTDYPRVYAEGNLRRVHAVRAPDGGVAAVCPWYRWEAELPSGAGFSVGVISPTATDPAHRGRGLSLACQRGCVAQMEDPGPEGADLAVLWTTLSTFRLYQQAGFQAVQGCAPQYPLWPSDAGLFLDWPGPPGRVGLHNPRAAGALSPHEAALHALHGADAAGMRFVRSEEDTRQIHSLPGMCTLLWWGAVNFNTPAAYLVISAASNRAGILEGGGSRKGLRALVHHALVHWVRAL